MASISIEDKIRQILEDIKNDDIEPTVVEAVTGVAVNLEELPSLICLSREALIGLNPEKGNEINSLYVAVVDLLLGLVEQLDPAKVKSVDEGSSAKE